MNWFFAFLAFLLGVANTVQSGVNAQLRESLGNKMLAAITSFVVGLVALLIAFGLFNKEPIPSVESFRQVSLYKLSGGVLGAFFVLTVIYIVRDLGSANMLCLIVAGQMLTAVVIDHFGLLGFASHSINPMRILGVVFLIAGVYFVLKY